MITRNVSLSCLALALVSAAAAGQRPVRTYRKYGNLRGWSPGSIAVTRRTVRGFEAPEGGKVKVAFFDADSTLRVSRSGNVSANSTRDVELLPGVASKLRQLNAQGYLVAAVSNQGGVAAGYVSLKDADGALAYMVRLLARRGAFVHYYDFAEARDHDRKPEIGMAEHAARAIKKATGRSVDWEASFMVGDSGWKRKVDVEPDGTPGEDFSNSDRGFATNVRRHFSHPQGFPFYHPREYFGWDEVGVRNFRKFEEVEAFLKAHPEFPE